MVDEPLNLSDRVKRSLARRVLSLSDGALRRFVGQPRVNDRGEPLELHTQAMLRLEAIARSTDYATRTPDEARHDMSVGIRVVEGEPRPVEHLWERRFGGVPCRIYAPRDHDGDTPVLVYLHGGGWTVGDLRTHDRPCRRLAHDLGWTVVSVDYRLAPEHPFPAAVDDAVAAFRDIREHAELFGSRPDRVAIGGDSAGGNLAAATTLVLRDAGEPQPLLQLLVYPAVDFHRRCESHRRLGDGYLLTSEAMDWYIDQYAPPDFDDPRASPLHAAAHADLAPAVVTAAGFDPLRDEAEAYAAKLGEAGVPVRLIYEAGLVHGYFGMDGVVPEADEASQRIVDALAELAEGRNASTR